MNESSKDALSRWGVGEIVPVVKSIPRPTPSLLPVQEANRYQHYTESEQMCHSLRKMYTDYLNSSKVGWSSLAGV